MSGEVVREGLEAEPSRLRATALPIVAIGSLVTVLGVVLASAGSTVGYDFAAYVGAAERLMDGRPLYDLTFVVSGGFGLFLYPPPFVLLALPFVPITTAFGPWPWVGFLLGSFLAGVAMLPVRRDIRWWILLLGGLSWPLAYSLKLGQVGPILFLLFVVGWRWLDRPSPLGIAIALGTIVKIQPALLFGWAVLSGRWRATTIGLMVLVTAVVASTLFTGVASWSDYLSVLVKASSPVRTPHNFAPGAIAYQLGAPEALGQTVQWLSTLIALGFVAYAALRARADVGYLTAVTASQLVSPILWDHYAMLLLLPTAWLLDHRQRWAAAIPLATSVLLIWLPPAIYPIAFWVALVAPLAVWRSSPGEMRPPEVKRNPGATATAQG